jgi:hypothetical protein
MTDTPEPTDAERAMPDGSGTLAHVRSDPYIEAYEERLADQRASAIAAGRRKGGAAGAAMAGAMLAMRDIVDGPKKDDAPVTVEASGDPHDLERDGFGLSVGGVDVSTPPLDRKPPVVGRRKRR